MELLRFHCFSDLRDFVVRTLCDREHLVVNAFPVYERLLERAGRVCAVMFSLHGPRAVTLAAIWELDTGSLLFYDSTGERFQRSQVAESPAFPPAACDVADSPFASAVG